MIQFNIDGWLLELAENTKLQYSKLNPLFAFDKLECERTASFDVPATPKNDMIFGLSRLIQGDGAGMRVRYAAQMQSDGVTKDGYIYITAATRDKYKCVFVTGELLGLQRMRDAGKIKDICNLTTTALYGTAYAPPSSYQALPYRAINYKRLDDSFPPIPSLRLYDIVSNCMQQLDVRITYPYYHTAWQSYRMIPNDVKGLTERLVSFHRVGTAYMSSSSTPTITNVYVDGLSWLFNTSLARVAYRRDFGSTMTVYYGNLRQLVPRQEVTINFPAIFPSDIFVGKFINGGTQFASECQFYGDYSFDDYGNVTGTPLAGRSVTIPAYEPFVFVSKSQDFYNGEESGGSTGWGWFRGAFPTQIEESMNMSGEVVVSNPNCNVSIADNFPDLTIIDLLKTIAALSGTALNYSDAEGVTFDSLEFDLWPSLNVDDKVLSVGDITRTFSDYAQTNRVVFDTSEHVLQSERLQQVYNVQNQNLEESREVQTIPFDEGGLYGSNMVYIRNQGGGYDKTTLASADTRGEGMLRVTLGRNTGIAGLCVASTSTQLRVRMTQYTYEMLTPQTAIYYNGVLYVWTKAQWSNGVATLSVSKIDSERLTRKKGGEEPEKK